MFSLVHNLLFKSLTSLLHIYVTDSVTGHLAFSSIYPLFVNRFGRSLRFCHMELDKEAISDGFMEFSSVLEGAGPGGVELDYRAELQWSSF